MNFSLWLPSFCADTKLDSHSERLWNGRFWRKPDIAIFHIYAGLNGLSGAALRR